MKKQQKSNLTSKIPEKQIEQMRILRANGLTYEEISKICNTSASTASKYTKDVAMLPKGLRQNPFQRITLKESEKVAKGRLRTVQNLTEVEEITDVDYWVEQHEEGTRFEVPPHILQAISLEKLQEIMEIPTNYKSNLSMKEWVSKYLNGESSTYFGYPHFLKWKPHMWTDPQLRIYDILEEYRKLMLEIHRDFGKTMIGDGVLTYHTVENRNGNYLVISETKKQSFKRVKHVGDTLITNKMIIGDYGFLPHIKKYEGLRQGWTKEEITVKRESLQTDPTLMCSSLETPETTGSHYDGVMYDDIWSRHKEKNNTDNKEKFISFYDGELEGCLEDAWELWIYTRKSPIDIYKTFKDRKYYVVEQLPAIIKYPSHYEYIMKNVNGQEIYDYVKYSDDYIISDPVRFTLDFFLEKKFKIDASFFESEYQLNPLYKSGKYFNELNLRWIKSPLEFLNLVEEKYRDKYLKITAFMDLALGRSERADYTAIAVVGRFRNKSYLLEVYKKRGATLDKMAEMIHQCYRDFAPLLKEVHIEADFHQAAYIDELRKKCSIPLKPFLSRQEQSLLNKDDSARRDELNGKPLRIFSQLGPIISNNNLWINQNMKEIKEFLDELRTFPNCEHFDILDAIGNATAVQRRKAALLYAYSQ